MLCLLMTVRTTLIPIISTSLPICSQWHMDRSRGMELIRPAHTRAALTPSKYFSVSVKSDTLLIILHCGRSLYYDTVGNADGTGVGLYEAGFWQSYRTHGPLRPSAYDRSQVFANVDGRQWLGGSYPRVIGYDAPYIHRGKYPGGTRRRHSLSGPALHGSYPSYHTPLPYGDARRSPYICGPEKYTETPIYGPVGSHLTYPAPGVTVPEPVVPPLLSWGR